MCSTIWYQSTAAIVRFIGGNDRFKLWIRPAHWSAHNAFYARCTITSQLDCHFANLFLATDIVESMWFILLSLLVCIGQRCAVVKCQQYAHDPLFMSILCITCIVDTNNGHGTI